MEDDDYFQVHNKQDQISLNVVKQEELIDEEVVQKLKKKSIGRRLRETAMENEWKKMKRVTDEADPTFLKRLYEWDSADTAMKGRRPNSVPTMCTHLWKATLDNTLEPGTHSIEVRATDMFGNIHTASGSYRTEKPE